MRKDHESGDGGASQADFTIGHLLEFSAASDGTEDLISSKFSMSEMLP